MLNLPRLFMTKVIFSSTVGCIFEIIQLQVKCKYKYQLYDYLSILFYFTQLAMKSKLYKIRNVTRNVSTSEELLRVPAGANNNHEQEVMHSIAESVPDRDTQFSQLVSMFQTFLKHSQPKQTHASHLYQLQARDREVLIPLPQIIDDKIAKGQLKSWIAAVVKSICSSAFNSFYKKEMSYEQVKIYCSENILKNIVTLSSQYILSPEELELIDSHLKKGVLSYLAAKYPLTDSNEINKKLEAAVHQVDNIEALQNNYFNTSNIVFQYRDTGNYNDLIMRVLNDVMGIMDAENQDEVSNYQDFEEFMSTLFQKVEDEEWMRKQDKQNMLHQLKLVHQHSDISSPHISEMENPKHMNRQEMAQYKEKMRKQVQEKEKYKSKVKEYTHYLIGRKIPENTPTFSEIQIESGNISIKSPTILRILTKWCEQLHDKFSNNYFSNRSQSVKVQRGGNVNSLLAWMREKIDQNLQQQLKVINESMNELFKNNYEMQTCILQHESNIKGDQFIDHIEKVSGKLSFKVVKNLHMYIITYLNKLIHGLLKASKQFFDGADIFDYTLWPSPPNLLTFKIGDLMRCKCSSKQKQILRIYKQLQRISRENPQKLKIIRIKNRLRSGTNDILMNIRFNNKITCEIQLGIKSKASDFIKCSNLFHHYLYQLERSVFGPLTELCSIWNSLDRRTNIFHELVEEEQLSAAASSNEHTCAKLKKKFDMLPFDKPFVCNLCSRTYHHNNFLKEHVRCNLCAYHLCAICRLNGESEQQLKNELISSPQLRQQIKGRLKEGQEIPNVGVCVFIESNEAKQELFTIVTYKKSKFLLGKRDGEIFEIYKLNSKKMMRKFSKKFVIFQINSNQQFRAIDGKQAINKYILPMMMRINYKKQKESINLMGLELNNEECQQILAVGTKTQKETVKNLFLVDNKLNKLPFNAEEFPHIRWLTLSRNLITFFEGIDKLTQLRNIIAVGSQIPTFPQQFYNLISIQHLSLPSNFIQSIDSRISNLRNLQTFELTGNQLTQLPQEIYDCTSLKVLKMDANQLTFISDNIAKLKNLEVLIYTSNQLTSVTEKIGQLSNLRQIFLGKNYSIQSLPQSLSNLHNITMFDISSTVISSIPCPAEGWPKLRLLNIQATQIRNPPSVLLSGEALQILIVNNIANFEFENVNSKGIKNLEAKYINAVGLPESINKMINLQAINLEGNNMISVQSAPLLPNLEKLSMIQCGMIMVPKMANLRKLKKLDLSQNRTLTSLPNQGINLPLLEDFVCCNSSLEQLSPCMLKWEKLIKLDIKANSIKCLFDQETEARIVIEKFGWPNLKFAYLNSNQLEVFPQAILNSSKIQYLHVSSNQIKEIPPSIKNLSLLYQIQMNYNQVQVLPTEFGELQKMGEAYLSCNKFKIVPLFVKDMPKLQIFYMDYNEINEVQCADWVLTVENIILGNLKDTTYKLKYPYEQGAAPQENVTNKQEENVEPVQGQQEIGNQDAQDNNINP